MLAMKSFPRFWFARTFQTFVVLSCAVHSTLVLINNVSALINVLCCVTHICLLHAVPPLKRSNSFFFKNKNRAKSETISVCLLK